MIESVDFDDVHLFLAIPRVTKGYLEYKITYYNIILRCSNILKQLSILNLI